MKLFIYGIAAILLLSLGDMSPSWGSEKKGPLLNDNILERFIEDFPSLLRDLRGYSTEQALPFEAIIQEGALIQDIDAVRMELERAQKDKGVRDIISRHGWDRNFTDVYITVLTAHSFIIAEGFLKGASDSPHNAVISKWMDSIHPDDAAAVRKNIPGLNEMIFSIMEE
jgi:hypothetical protein